MSRTDRHRPHRVQEADPFEQNYYWFERGQNWGWDKIFLHRTCNCRWHGMYYLRTQENRQRRHQDQRRARQALKGNRLAWDERML